MTIEQLIERWREDARVADRLGDERGRDLTLTRLAELQGALEEETERLVEMDEAVRLSRYSAISLRRMVRDGRLRNRATEPGAYLFRRGDLPKKPGGGVAFPDIGGGASPDPDVGHSEVAGVRPLALVSRRQIARAVVSGEQV